MTATLNFRLDESLATPLYIQLASRLKELIYSAFFQVNEALPSERSLCEALGISRVTTRRAVDLLCKQGLLERRHGSGTYITLRLEQPLTRLTNFSEELRQRGFTPGSKWLSRSIATANSEEILSLGLSPSSQVARLKRLRTADKVVMAIETSTVPSVYLPDPKKVTHSLYGHLEELQHAPVRALQHIRAVNATAEQARMVQIKTGAAMLLITRVAYLANGAAVELTHSYCRNDYYDFVVELFK